MHLVVKKEIISFATGTGVSEKHILQYNKAYILSILSFITMKRILLKFDEKFFYKMKADKQRREKELNSLISWENYIKLLFGFTKITGR